MVSVPLCGSGKMRISGGSPSAASAGSVIDRKRRRSSASEAFEMDDQVEHLAHLGLEAVLLGSRGSGLGHAAEPTHSGRARQGGAAKLASP
jgi:hypothetical protein